MQIFISKSLYEVLENIDVEELKNFNNKTKELKELNKTQIISLERTITLPKKDMELYLYNIQANKYILFTFKDKNSMLIFDEIEIVDKDDIKSLVYFNDGNPTDT